jgi:FlaA1/EpsC-like NDP-sugar epimerase
VISTVVNRLSILPRWIIILLDLAVVIVSGLLSYLLRFNFVIEGLKHFHVVSGLLIIANCYFLSTLITKSYAGIVRYTGMDDGYRVLKTNFLSLLLLCVVNLIYYYNSSRNFIPYSVLLMVFFISYLGLFYYRLLVKSLFTYYKTERANERRVLIFGAGQSGSVTKQVLDSDFLKSYKVIAFIDDQPKKIGKMLNGAPILSARKLPVLIQDFDIQEVIISVIDLSFERKNEIVDECLQYHVKVRSVPPVEKWVKGELKEAQIREIKIDDLLGRDAILLANESIQSELTGKSICITGAAGSIGSELARQVVQYNPKKLILIDQAESPLYFLQRELVGRSNSTNLVAFVADICNESRMQYIIESERPEIIFHAAAYKHVPLMETNPIEAVHVNVMGTRRLADIAMKYKVKKFVMISTDKAVNPTNVMGCTKRIAEIYVQSLSNYIERLGIGETTFVTTRFGNVLGSNGSVIPIFKNQIDSGGPLTVTHPDITRYFMTIPEACQLVIEAGVMAQGGEIFIFDMGKPVRIYDLAKKMIKLSGKTVGQDIDIVFTGLREGEKLFEELLNNKENTIPTHHEKILKAKVSEYAYDEISRYINLLEDLMQDRNDLKMVALMKEIVPEFKSNYSRFEVLDIY